jgi:hypothetical protein
MTALGSAIAVEANGLPQALGFSPHCLPGTSISELLTVACHKRRKRSGFPFWGKNYLEVMFEKNATSGFPLYTGKSSFFRGLKLRRFCPMESKTCYSKRIHMDLPLLGPSISGNQDPAHLAVYQ